MTAHDHNIGRYAQDPDLAPGHHYVRKIRIILENERKITIRHMESLAYGKGMGSITFDTDDNGNISRIMRTQSNTKVKAIESFSSERFPATTEASRIYNLQIESLICTSISHCFSS